VTSIRQQLRNNAVALISLAVAISSRAYNAWRNERTARNRNVRTAAFEVLMRAADLERVTFLASARTPRRRSTASTMQSANCARRRSRHCARCDERGAS